MERHRTREPHRFELALRERKPVELTELEYRGAEGSVIAVPLTTAQMIRLPRRFVRHKVLEAAQFAQRSGASVIGLGAMTSVVTRGGRWLTPLLPGCTLTNGSALTAATVADHAEKLGGLQDKRIAILGGSGSVGLCIAQLLQQRCRELLLVGRSSENLRHAATTLDSESVRTTNDYRAAVNADLIVVATAGPDPVISMAEIGAGTRVLDLSEPSNVAFEAGCCSDARLVPSGRLRLDGVDLSNCIPELAPGVVFACLAETMLFALEHGLDKHSVEQPDARWARELAVIAVSAGMRPAA